VSAPDPRPAADAQYYARLAGFLYLATNATAIFAFAMRGRVLDLASAEHSSAAIAAAPRLLRLSIAGELVTVAGVLVLVASLYVVLERVDRSLAFIATLWRIAENAVLAVTTFNASALLMASGGGDAAASVRLVGLFTGVYGAGYQAGFFFLGLGSTLFSWLWWRSRWVPRAIAGWGIFASLVMALGSLALIVAPELRPAIGMAYMGPMGVYELGLGLWLLVRGIGAAAPSRSQAEREASIPTT
jgi:hypothetical protein